MKKSLSLLVAAATCVASIPMAFGAGAAHGRVPASERRSGFVRAPILNHISRRVLRSELEGYRAATRNWYTRNKSFITDKKELSPMSSSGSSSMNSSESSSN